MSVTFGAIDNTKTTTFRRDGREIAYAACIDLGDDIYVNFANTNARALLDMIGLAGRDLEGSLPIADMRRALMGVRARFDRIVVKYVREDRTEYGEPRVREDGAVDLRPVRVCECGTDEGEIKCRLDALTKLVDAAAAAGATDITWG